jgi:hypothetical protein
LHARQYFTWSEQMTEVSTMRELTLEECDQVSGGVVLLGVSIGISSLVALKIGINVGSSMAGIIAILDNNGLYNRDSLEQIAGSTQHAHSNGGGFGSDRRIKTDVQLVGHLDHLELDVYSWEYTNEPGTRYVGVMAQDLLAREDLSHAVFVFEDGPHKGFYGVDYSALGLTCVRESEFDGNVDALLVTAIAA